MHPTTSTKLPYGDTTPADPARLDAGRAGAHTITARHDDPTERPERLRYRYYLIWIAALPPSSEVAEISEATLFS